MIEIMLVLTLIAILSSIAMPSLRGFAISSRLKSSSHAIRDMLLFAQDVAITERIGYLVVFDLDRNRYWLASSENFDTTDLSTSVAGASSTFLAGDQATSLQTPSGVTQPTTVSRTSMILGIPQKPSNNVSLAQITTQHNSQSRQINTRIDYIYFSPNASAEDAVVYIQDRKGKTTTITVEAATGRVRIQEISTEQVEALGLSTTQD